MFTTIIWFLFVYLFSSIPNGYLITKWFSGKDIRKIGREKISGSNIMHNIGKGPGILSGGFDILKGVVATAGAYYLGLPPAYQAIAGILAVCGQMWPIFLKFWGGRGGATSIGAMLGLNPLLALSAIGIWILTKLISREMGAAIGMMIFYLVCGGFGIYFGLKEIYMFSFIALFLVFVQRGLGKPGSLSQIKDKKVFLWRLLLDRDTKERMKSEKAMW
jgi:glycerol-3-phosphate acyltransferase PlsY